MHLNRFYLKDLASISLSGVDKKISPSEEIVRLCNYVDVYKNYAVTSLDYDHFMVASASKREIDGFSLKKGDIAITKDSETRDDIGMPCYIADDFNHKVLLGYHCALIRANSDLIDSKYLTAYLNSEVARKYFSNNATGSGQRASLSKEVLENLPVFAPSIQEQRNIGSLLSNIDRQIKLNCQINDNLEAIAKQLYDYWFVQFDFPDEKGRPYKSSGGKMVWNDDLKRKIPEIFECCTLDEFIKLKDSQRVPLSNKERLNRKGIYPYYGATGIIDYVNNYIFDGDYLLLAEDGSTSDINGNPIVQYIWGKSWVNNHAHIVLPKTDGLILYTYQLLKNIPAKMIETGSIQKKISQVNLLTYKIVLPMHNLIKEYCQIVSPIWEQRKNNIEEMIALTKQRDKLLPLLMNGQATVNYHL